MCGMSRRVCVSVRCQVIVKLSNRHPANKGGLEWRVEGIRNEHIVAVGVYYYDANNVSEGRMYFRQDVSIPDSKWSYQDVLSIFGFNREVPRSHNQFLGTVATKSDRCIAFPNVLRQQSGPMHLLDSERGGVLRSLVFLLVDPSVRVPSTADVPPQQRAWVEREMSSSVPGLLALCLPEVLVREVMAYVGGGGGITREEARTHREKLEADRKLIAGKKMSRRR